MGVIERIRDDLRLPILYVSHDRKEIERLATAVISLGYTALAKPAEELTLTRHWRHLSNK